MLPGQQKNFAMSISIADLSPYLLKPLPSHLTSHIMAIARR